MPKRLERINELIQREIGKIIFHELEFSEGVLVTVTKVETSGDFEKTKIWISIFPEKISEKIFQVINRKKGYFQKLLSEKLLIYRVPKIEFILDRTEVEAQKIEEIFKK